MGKGVIYGRNSFDGRNWVRVRKGREKPCGAWDLAGWRREGCRDEFDLTLTQTKKCIDFVLGCIVLFVVIYI